MPETEPTTRRAFHCQDSLWDTFADLAIERDCTIDDLINEAMRAFISSSNSQQPMAQPAQPIPMQPAQPMPMQPAQPMSMQQAQPMQPAQPMQQAQPQMPASQSAFNRAPTPAPLGRQPLPAPGQPRQLPNFNGRPASPLPPPATPAFLPQGAPAPAAQSFSAPPQGPRVPPPSPTYKRPPSIFEEPAEVGAGKPMVLASLNNNPQRMSPQPMAQQPQYQAAPQPGFGQPPLYIIFANQKYTVDKDKYIIGRSSQLADLVIRDGNISRKHCAILFKNGQYYIKDLDSTNGIEFQGNRIDTKRIEEGDQFNICEFQFTFTYR